MVKKRTITLSSLESWVITFYPGVKSGKPTAMPHIVETPDRVTVERNATYVTPTPGIVRIEIGSAEEYANVTQRASGSQQSKSTKQDQESSSQEEDKGDRVGFKRDKVSYAEEEHKTVPGRCQQ